MLELNGQVALVTGAGKRLGRGIALALANAGCDMAVHYHKSHSDAEATAAAIRGLGRRATVVRADQTVTADVSAAVDQVAQALGRLDHLIVSAAAFERLPFAELTRAHWDTMIETNLTGCYEWCFNAAPWLQKSPNGSIVALLDVAAFHAWRGYAHYCVAKAGLEMLVRVLALELAPAVRVNGVAPGTVLPPEDMTADELEKIRRAIPLGRIGSPDDVARAVHYLAAAPFVTGTTMMVDGGRSAMGRL